MVVTARPATSDIWVWHENARLPSMCTMQAPHSPAPQPNLVPVSLRPSRITHNKGVCGGASVDAGLPFTLKRIVIFALPVRIGQAIALHKLGVAETDAVDCEKRTTGRAARQ